MNKKEEKILHNQVINYLESNSKGAIASKIILSTLALGGVVCMGAIAPNIFRAVHGCSRYNDAAKSFKKRSCFSTISKFKKDGLIQLQKQKKRCSEGDAYGKRISTCSRFYLSSSNKKAKNLG